MQKTLVSVWLLISGPCYSQGLVDGFMKGKGNTDIALGASGEIFSQFYSAVGLVDISRTIFSGSI